MHDRKQLVILKNIEEETKQEQTDQFIWDLSCAVENIRRQYSTECIFCINPEPVAPDRLTTAYKEINKALEYKKAAKVEGIFSDQLLSSFAVRSYYFPLNIEYELSRQIRQGDFENAKKQLEILFQINFSQEPLHLYMTRCLLYDLSLIHI